MRKYHHLLFLILVFPGMMAGQNLVPNFSFEEFSSCPGSFSRNKKDFKILNWYAPNAGTPDAFNACGRGEADVPYNWAGVSEAYDGKGYCGLYVWFKFKDYREYIQCKLSEPLVEDSIYRISFRYKLSSYSKFAIDRIGLLLSDSAVMVNHDRPWNIQPTLAVVNDSILNPRTGLWEHAFMEYRAKGGEQYLTIGNFDANALTRQYEIKHRTVQEEMLKDAAYYYLDEVIVRLKHDPTEIKPLIASFSDQNIRLHERYILDNIRFDFDSHKLLSRSFDQLDELVHVLKTNPEYKLEIAGYTDDVGGDGYNLSLSIKRAKTVANYLIQKGIARERITSAGYGKRYPLIEGTSDEIRSVNRRVELKFSL